MRIWRTCTGMITDSDRQTIWLTNAARRRASKAEGIREEIAGDRPTLLLTWGFLLVRRPKPRTAFSPPFRNQTTLLSYAGKPIVIRPGRLPFASHDEALTALGMLTTIPLGARTVIASSESQVWGAGRTCPTTAPLCS